MMKIYIRALCVLIAAVMSGMAVADNIYTIRLDRGSSKRGVAAFDLSKPAMLWEAYPCRVANFGEKTSVGVVVGCDDSNVLLLDINSGAVLWRRDLAVIEPDELKRERRPYREIKINRFHKETPLGFLLSSHDEHYVFLGKKGEYMMYCGPVSCTSSPMTDREPAVKK